MDLKKTITLHGSKEDRLAKYDGPDKVISSVEYQEILDAMKDRDVMILKSKLPTFDKLSEGFEAGEVVVVTGYTKHGKTSFCQSLTVSFEEADVKSLWFSWEVTPRQFFSKFSTVPLFYLPKELKGNAINWMEERVIEAKLKYGISAVFLDHLHFLVDLAQTKHPSITIGAVMRSLKQLALSQEIVIFLIAHTKQPKGDQRPGLDSLRDSSFIAQESDMALTVQRIKDKKSGIYGNEAWLTILTHRRMGVMEKKIKLVYKDKQYFEVDIARENEEIS